MLALLPLLGGLRPNPPHLLLVVGNLLVQTGRGGEGIGGGMKKKKEDMIDCEYNLVSKSIVANLKNFT